MPLILPILGKQRQADAESTRPAWSTEWVLGQPGLHTRATQQTPASKKHNDDDDDDNYNENMKMKKKEKMKKKKKKKEEEKEEERKIKQKK